MKYTSKMFNIITICMSIYFFIYATFLIVGDSIIENEIQTCIARMKEENYKLNTQWLEENKNTGVGGAEVAPDAKFKNASEVVIAATDAIMTANSFDIIVTGQISAHVPSLGLTINPEVKFTFRLYENGDRYEENLRYISGMDYGQKKGSQQIRYANGSEIMRRTTDVTKSGNNISANFRDAFSGTSGLYFAPQYYYNVSTETILKETYFKIVKLDNGELEYHSQVYLKPDSAVTKYCILMQSQSGALKLPVFSSVVMTTVADSNGNPKSLNVIELYEIEMNLLGGIRAQNKDNLTYQFLSINQQINTPLPI